MANPEPVAQVFIGEDRLDTWASKPSERVFESFSVLDDYGRPGSRRVHGRCRRGFCCAAFFRLTGT
jgi:hypothetical protein